MSGTKTSKFFTPTPTGYNDPSKNPTTCQECGGYRTGVVANPGHDCKCAWPKYGPKFRSKYGFWCYWVPQYKTYMTVPDEADYE